MPVERHTVEVQSDLIQRLSRAKPIPALAELIWNALDADSTHVAVRLDYGDLGLKQIAVSDNGHGISRGQAPKLFTRLGGSWKTRGGRTKTLRRMLHGYEGRGRFKAFALGRVADWVITYKNTEGSRLTYTVSMIESNLREIRVGEESAAHQESTGVEVRISEPHKNFKSLETTNLIQHLCEICALYLKDYRDVRITIDGNNIDPDTAIIDSVNFDINPIDVEDRIHPVNLEIIEWRSGGKRVLYLCNQEGFPLSQVSTRFHVGDFRFSAYLKSHYVSQLHQEEILELAEMNPALSASIEEAKGQIKEFFRNRAAERAKSVVESWKEDNIYPYVGEASSPVDAVERKVFDIVAVTASDYMPEFESVSQRNKALHFRMLRTAIEKSPNELQLILQEVLGLPKRKQADLAKLLQETSLSAIISAAKIVADRLKTLQGLEAIIFDPDMKARLKERSQLHQILADNTWMFGEEFALSVSDQSLTNVLRKHKECLDDGTIIDQPVTHINQKRGIVDLMFSRALRNHRGDELDHLVVELKAPRVKLTSESTTQIKGYAFSVAEDERFRDVRTRWNFWLISNDVDTFVEHEVRSANLPRGVLYQSEDQASTIWVKTWSQIFAENKARLQFFQEKLEYQVDQGSALNHLHERYEEFLKGVVTTENTFHEDESGSVASRGNGRDLRPGHRRPRQATS